MKKKKTLSGFPRADQRLAKGDYRELVTASRSRLSLAPPWADALAG